MTDIKGFYTANATNANKPPKLPSRAPPRTPLPTPRRPPRIITLIPFILRIALPTHHPTLTHSHSHSHSHPLIASTSTSTNLPTPTITSTTLPHLPKRTPKPPLPEPRPRRRPRRPRCHRRPTHRLRLQLHRLDGDEAGFFVGAPLRFARLLARERVPLHLLHFFEALVRNPLGLGVCVRVRGKEGEEEGGEEGGRGRTFLCWWS